MNTIYLVVQHDTFSNVETVMTFVDTRRAAQAIATSAELRKAQAGRNELEYYVQRVDKLTEDQI